MFKVIQGDKENYEKELVDKRAKKVELYKSNYHSNLYGFNENSSVEKAVFYGVKYISRYNIKKVIKDKHSLIIKKYLEERFDRKIRDNQVDIYSKFLTSSEIQELNNLLRDMETKELLKYNLDIQDIKQLITKLTYREFISIFPIIKEYDGKKFECKDYFSVIDYLKNIDLDSKIDIDNIDEFFWAYYNNDIMLFVVNEISCIDSISLMNGGKTLMDSFLEEVDPDKKIHTYTYHENENYMYDNMTGRTFSVKKVNPDRKNFKIIK